KSHASTLELGGGPSSRRATTLKTYGDNESNRGSSDCYKETTSSQDFRSINAFAILALDIDAETEKDSTITTSAEKLVVDRTSSSGRSVVARSQGCSSSERDSRNATQKSAEANPYRRAKKRHARGYLMKRPQKRTARQQASHEEKPTMQTKKNDEAGTKEQEQENDLTTRSRQEACPPCWAFCVASFSGLVPYSYGSPLSSTSVHFARMLDRNSSSAVALPSTSAQRKTLSSKMKKPVHQGTAKSSCNKMRKSAPNLQCSANRSPPTAGHASSCSLHDVEPVTNMGNYRVTKLSGVLSQSDALLLHGRPTVFVKVLRGIIATLADFSRQHLLPVWTSMLALPNTAAAVVGALAFRGPAKSACAGSFVLRGSTVVDGSSRWTNQPQARLTAWRKQCESSVLAMGSAGLSRFALLLLLGLLVSCGMAAGQDAWGEDEKPWGKDEKQFEDLTKSSATLPATCNGVIGHGEWHSAWLRVIFPGAPDVHSQHWVLRLVPADFKKTKADETALWALWQALGDKEDTSPSNEAGDYGSDVIITYGEVAEWSKHFVKPMTCTAPRGKFELRYYPNPTPLGDLKCPPPPVKESECSSTNNGSKVTTETEWKMMANSRYQRLRKIIEAPAEALARAPPMALWNAWAFSRLAEMAALGKTVGEADGAGSPIVWVRGYIEGGGEAAFGPPKWRIVVVQKRFETNLGKWVKGARSQAGKGGQAVVNAMKSAAESVRNYHEMGKAHRMIHPKNMLAHVVDTGKVEVVLGNLMGIVERVQAILQTDPVQEPVQPNLQTSSSNSCEEEELIRGGWQDVTRGGRAVADLGSPCSVKNYYSAYPVAVDFYSAMGGDTESRPLEYIDPAAVTRFNARGDRWQSGDVTYQQSDVWSVGVMVLKMLKQFFTDTAGDNDTEAADTIKAVDEVLRVELRAEDDSAMALQKWATKSSCSRSWGDSVRGFLSRNRHHALLDNKLSAALDPTSQGAGGFLPKPKAENASSEK
ncbi:unnamed protein product, partial [Amoebophrya sp. A25]